MRQKHFCKAMAARSDWLEDVLAGLLINGVRIDEIEVQEQPGDLDHVTVVCVRGVPTYKWTISFLPAGD